MPLSLRSTWLSCDTSYGTSRNPPRSFYAHHSAAISAAIAANESCALENATASLARSLLLAHRHHPRIACAQKTGGRRVLVRLSTSPRAALPLGAIGGTSIQRPALDRTSDIKLC